MMGVNVGLPRERVPALLPLEPGQVVWRNHYLIRNEPMWISPLTYKHKRSAVRVSTKFFWWWQQDNPTGFVICCDGRTIHFPSFLLVMALPESVQVRAGFLKL